MKPIIGVVLRPDVLDNKSIFKINDNVRTSIISSGGIPIGILPIQNIDYNKSEPIKTAYLTNEEKENIISVIKLCDGILLAGGSKWFEYDEFIVNYAVKNNIPVLGVCLGMQTIVSALNCNKNIINDITKLNNTIINHNQPNKNYVHNVRILPNTKLYNIIGKEKLMVNSRHSYHCEKLNKLGPSAYSSDGLLEAVELPNKQFILGVQWHPEDLINSDNDSIKIFRTFIEACIKYKEKKA